MVVRYNNYNLIWGHPLPLNPRTVEEAAVMVKFPSSHSITGEGSVAPVFTPLKGQSVQYKSGNTSGHLVTRWRGKICLCSALAAFHQKNSALCTIQYNCKLYIQSTVLCVLCNVYSRQYMETNNCAEGFLWFVIWRELITYSILT